jgi:hypothetical protein
MKPSTSPERNTFQRNNYIKRCEEQGKSLDDPQVKATIEWYDSWDELDDKRLNDKEWKNFNLEWDLRTTDWILEKARTSTSYAQNLYAALCNNDFAKNTDSFRVLSEDYWSCSWRYAGGIIADMCQHGDYIDWYCSGIQGTYDEDSKNNNFVQEGHVTDEIKTDLAKIGWVVVTVDEI